MGIEDSIRQRADCSDHIRAKSYIGDKMPVHYIYVYPVSTSGKDIGYLLAKLAQAFVTLIPDFFCKFRTIAKYGLLLMFLKLERFGNMQEENKLTTIDGVVHEPVSPESYRDAMSHFASAVHIVTTAGIAGRRGTTVSACCSLSDNPPTLLICVMKQHEGNRLFIENGHFCINTLAGKHRPISDVFAGRSPMVNQAERFSQGQWTMMKTGSPVLEDALASFDCQLVCWYDHATHYILCGRVIDIRRSDAKDALIYLNRQYNQLPL